MLCHHARGNEDAIEPVTYPYYFQRHQITFSVVGEGGRGGLQTTSEVDTFPLLPLRVKARVQVTVRLPMCELQEPRLEVEVDGASGLTHLVKEG